MSYKSAWFGKSQVEKIAEKFGSGITAETLMDRNAEDECLDGGYGGNIANKLHRHPLTVTSEIEEVMEREYEYIRIQRIERRPYPRDEETGLWRCSCGWTGEGTGYNGALVEGDRCPECGLYL